MGSAMSPYPVPSSVSDWLRMCLLGPRVPSGAPGSDGEAKIHVDLWVGV